MLRKQLVILAALALVTLVATGWISDRATRVMIRSVAALDHTRDVLVTMDYFRAALAEAESDARGFAITGEPGLLIDFERASRTLHSTSHSLKVIASSSERDPELVAGLDRLVDRRLALLRRLVALKQNGGPLEQIDAEVQQGTATTSLINERLDHVRAEELQRFDQQTGALKSARRFATYAPWTMLLIALIVFGSMLALAFATFMREKAMRDELRAAIAEQERALRRAQEADELKEQFLAAVSHDLRTPLTAIIGWCTMLQMKGAPPHLLEEALATIDHAARVQSQLIEDLLDVSRATTGRLRLRVTEVNVPELLERAIASVNPSAQQKGITIRTSIESGLPHIRADSARLEQVIWNLLSNSVKFTREGGTVEVGLRPAGTHLEIVVRDSGEGIAPDLLPHIFDRFRQGRSSAARQGGLGLGLSIVKSLVELHGGTVSAHSEGAGKGATFTVLLPLHGEAALSSPLRDDVALPQ